jgi:hypothetical protein
MKLTKLQQEAIVRAIMQDVPKPDKAKRYVVVQAAIVKAMSPECRKVYNKTPKALATQYLGDLIYDNVNWASRDVVVGDVSKDVVETIVKPYVEEDAKYSQARRQLEIAVRGCTTLKQLEKALPEFKKYYPKEDAPSANLPALANVVADLSKLGWPKK